MQDRADSAVWALVGRVAIDPLAAKADAQHRLADDDVSGPDRAVLLWVGGMCDRDLGDLSAAEDSMTPRPCVRPRRSATPNSQPESS